MRILFIYTVEASLRTAVKGQIRFLVDRGYEVHVAIAEDHMARTWVASEGGVLHEVAMTRSASPSLKDLRALFLLVRLIKSIRPDLVVSGSPKAGFLGTLAARLTSSKSIYVLHGLRLEGARGSKRRLMWLVEWTAMLAAQQVVAVGRQLADRAAALHLVGRRSIRVLGEGSANGVDVKRFAPPSYEQRVRARRRFGLDERNLVFGFIGRLTADKGIEALIRAWSQTRTVLPEARLLVAGEPDRDVARDRDLAERLLKLEGVHLLGFVADVAELLHGLDVNLLPSRREGLPTVVLEAASAGVPTVMADCTGARDAVQAGVTGVIVPVDDADALAKAMCEAAEVTNRTSLALAARERTLRHFQQETVWASWAECYDEVGARS